MSNDIVVYEGLAVSIPHAERDDGVRALEDMSETTRRKVVASVVSSMDMFVTRVKSGTAVTQEEKDNFCKDVGIWFCEQVRTGNSAKAFVGSVQ